MDYITLIFGSIRGAIWGGAAILFLIIGSVKWYQHSAEQIAHSQTRTTLKATETKLALADQVNRDNDEKLDDLAETNRELAEGRRADKEASSKAVAAAMEEKQALQNQVEHERAERAKIYKGNTNAKEWADTPVPADVYERLRNLTKDRTAGAHKIGGEAGASVRRAGHGVQGFTGAFAASRQLRGKRARYLVQRSECRLLEHDGCLGARAEGEVGQGLLAPAAG